MYTAARRLSALAALALVAIAVAASAATAATSGMSISEGGSITTASLGTVRFTSPTEEMFGGITFVCRITDSGSLTRGLVRIEAAFGSLSGTSTSECSGGTLRTLSVLQGSLSVTSWLEPEARGACNVAVSPLVANARNLCAVVVEIANTTLSLSVFAGAVNCGYRGDANLQASLTRTGRSGQEYTFGLFAILASSTLAATGEGAFCPRQVTASGGLGALSPVQTFTVLSAAGVVVSPREVAFGRIATTEIARRTVTLEFEAAARVTEFHVVNGVAFAATDPGRCKGREFAAGGRCTFTVAFLPPGERTTEYRDELVIETSLGRIVVPISGGTT